LERRISYPKKGELERLKLKIIKEFADKVFEKRTECTVAVAAAEKNFIKPIVV
jgi:hypothetical protein